MATHPYRRNKKSGRCSVCSAWINEDKGWRQWKPADNHEDGEHGRTGGKYLLFCGVCRERRDTGEETGNTQEELESGTVPFEETKVEQADKQTIAQALADLLTGDSLDESRVEAIAAKVADEKLRKLKAVKVAVTFENRPEVEVEGAHEALEKILKSVAAGPVLLIGPAGAGKTTLGEHVAKALDLPFYFNGAIHTEYKLTGFVDAGGNYHSTPFREAFENGGVYLFDEMDASSPQALLAFNSGLANGHMDFPDSPKPVTRHPNFIPLASANTWGTGADREYVGRNQLDAATLDRFIPITIDYDMQLEQSLAGEQQAWLQKVWKIRDKVAEYKMRHIVSTRAIVRGRIMLEGGMKEKDVERLVLKRNLGDDDWKRVTK